MATEFVKREEYRITKEQVKRAYEKMAKDAKGFLDALKLAAEIVDSAEYKGLFKQKRADEAIIKCYKTFGRSSTKVIKAYFESRDKKTFDEWLNEKAKLAIQYRIMHS